MARRSALVSGRRVLFGCRFYTREDSVNELHCMYARPSRREKEEEAAKEEEER